MKAKKILALLLVLALCMTAFAACSSGSGSSGTSGSTSTGTTTGETGGETGGETAEPGEAGGETYTFPLAEQVTFTAWHTNPTSDPSLGITTINDIEAVQRLEAKTNVHIEWDVPASGTETDTFNLMITSGEYPDLIFAITSYYKGGVDKAITDGVIIPLNDMIETYAPDYMKLISQNDALKRDCITDGGNYASIAYINTPDQGPWYGLTVRKDWLDKCGLDVPVTYDDWHDMLVAFKEQCGATNPLWLNQYASDMFNIFPAGYGIAALGAGSQNSAFYNVDGTVHYGPIEEGYHDYITMLNQWYSEGLLDPDFYTRATDVFVPDSLSSTGKCGAFADIYTLIDMRPMMSEDTTISTIPVAQPVLKEGDTVHLRQYNWPKGTSDVAISTQCENPELALSWLNLGSIEEYSYLCYWGEEGNEYEIGEDGEPHFTDKVLNNPDINPGDYLTKYFWRAPGMYRWSRELEYAGPLAISAIEDVWLQHSDGAYFMPNITLTDAEGQEFSTKMADILTYVAENTTKFIRGERSLDEWDAFVETVKGMGIDDAIALEQAALDRFNER